MRILALLFEAPVVSFARRRPPRHTRLSRRTQRQFNTDEADGVLVSSGSFMSETAR